jgi:SAM-dependent methyltransferase
MLETLGVKRMNAKTSDIERLSAELHEANRALHELRVSPAQVQVMELESIISELLGPLPLPPVGLRRQVHANASAATFLRQGHDACRKVLELFGEMPSAPILDWGCGIGSVLRWLLAYPAWRKIYRGCDAEAEPVAWLQEHGIAAKRCTTALPYETGEMAGIFSFGALTRIHPSRFRTWFVELGRVLKPGARAYLAFNGDLIVESKEERHVQAIADFRRNGWAWVDNDAQYNSTSFVKHAFVERAASDIFKLHRTARRDYQRMDAMYAERI